MSIGTINEFLESTCVIVVIAYLLKRRLLIGLLTQRRLRRNQVLILGGTLSLMGIVELVFLGDRAPYDTYALIATFAVLRGGGPVGLVTALGIICGAALTQDSLAVFRIALSLLATVGLGWSVRALVPGVSRQSPRMLNLVGASLLAIVLAEAASILIRLWVLGPGEAPFRPSLAVLKIAANSFGIILLQIIVNDAQVRTETERLRVEAERNRTLLAETKLAALRARIHPHFLFNTLTSIAALCRVDPAKAEIATIQLAQITRRALEADVRATVPLSDELDYVRDYLEIEQMRLGSRLTVHWDLRPSEICDRVRVPAFSLQTLVENAVHHGIAQSFEPGNLTITVRGFPRHALVAVTDDGVGMDSDARARALPKAGDVSPLDERPHGLALSQEQLVYLYGPSARLRIFSRRDVGTRVVFVVPLGRLAPPLPAPPVRSDSRNRNDSVGSRDDRGEQFGFANRTRAL